MAKNKYKNPWYDEMTSVWVSKRTRETLNDFRDLKLGIKTCDDVIEMLVTAYLRQELTPKQTKKDGTK